MVIFISFFKKKTFFYTSTTQQNHFYSWGLLAQSCLPTRTGRDVQQQFERLFVLGVVRHNEFEIDELGRVQEKIEVDDAYDDTSLKHDERLNRLSKEWVSFDFFFVLNL